MIPVHETLGTVETKSLVGAVTAADAMLKSAKVSIADFRVVGSGLVAAVVIARPNEELEKLML